MRFFITVIAAALLAAGTLSAQASPVAQANGQFAHTGTTEFAAQSTKKKTAKKPAKKKKEKIEYMRATG